jgi:hypothetical protein
MYDTYTTRPEGGVGGRGKGKGSRPPLFHVGLTIHYIRQHHVPWGQIGDERDL